MKQELDAARLKARQIEIEMKVFKERYYSLKGQFARACRKVKELENENKNADK